MSLERREFFNNLAITSLALITPLQSTNYDIETRGYEATDLLRDLTDETRGAQTATGDAIITAADSGDIDNAQINNAGTINATIILDEVGSKEELYIYEGGDARRLGYEYHPNEYDLGDRFADLENEDRLVSVLNEFNKLYIPELFNQPASELLPDQTENATDIQTETPRPTPTSKNQQPATDTQTEIETDEQNGAGAGDTIDEIISSPYWRLTLNILTFMGGTGLTVAAIYRYIFKNNSDE